MFVKFTAVLGRERDRQRERKTERFLQTTQGNTGHVLDVLEVGPAT